MNVKKMMSMLLISHLIWSAAFKLLDHSWKPRSHHQQRPSQVAVWSPCKFEVHGEITERTRHVVKEKTSREWSKNSSYAGSCLDIPEKMILNERSEVFKSGRVFNYYGPDLRAFWSHVIQMHFEMITVYVPKKVNVHFTLSFHSALQSKLNQILPCIDAFPNNSCVKTCWSSSELQRLTECVVLWDKSRDIFWSEASRLGTRCAGDGGRPCLMPQVSNSFSAHLDS